MRPARSSLFALHVVAKFNASAVSLNLCSSFETSQIILSAVPSGISFTTTTSVPLIAVATSQHLTFLEFSCATCVYVKHIILYQVINYICLLYVPCLPSLILPYALYTASLLVLALIGKLTYSCSFSTNMNLYFQFQFQ